MSGFLISNQLFAEWQAGGKISLRIFYFKRAFRIFPPYLFILLIYIFFPAFHERERLAPLWKMFTFTQNLGQDFSVYGTFSHAWSLCVEEQFYLTLPLLLILIFYTRMKRKSGWLIPFFFLLTLFLRWIIWHYYLYPIRESQDFWISWYKHIYYPTYTRLDGLITGVGIAATYRFREAWLVSIRRYKNWFLLAGVALFILCYFFCTDELAAKSTIFGFSLIAIAFGCFVLSAILPGSILFKFKSSITRNLATLSYSLYLSHKGLIHLTQLYVNKLGITPDSNLMLLICIVVCITGAFTMRVLVEKPFFRLRNAFIQP